MMVIYPLSDADEVRCEELMEKYQDRPMDLADSSLVTLAERSGIRRIFTLDSDFRFYRTGDGGTFEIVPQSIASPR
jgi:predicted nucleic acid-binding protein